MNKLLIIIKNLVATKSWAEIKIKIKNGEIVLIEKSEQIKPN